MKGEALPAALDDQNMPKHVIVFPSAWSIPARASGLWGLASFLEGCAYTGLWGPESLLKGCA
eukprot:257268-Pelagomonas_calceolata.AAC.6